MTFDDLQFKPHSIGNGVRARHMFPNGYGASVVRFMVGSGAGSYGADEGLYELAVLGPDGRLTYSTPITTDVCGHLTESDVTALLAQIEALPTAVETCA